MVERQLKPTGDIVAKTRKRTRQEIRQHLEEVLDFLQLNLGAYHSGRRSAWLALPAQLFILLCDPSARPPLVQKVIPDFSLHPLRVDPSKRGARYKIYLPRIRFGPHGLATELFDLTQPRMPLSEWLDQTVAVLNIGDSGQYVKLTDLIKETRHKAGPGHYDTERVSPTLQATEGLRTVEHGTDRPLREKLLVAVAQYVVHQVREQLADPTEQAV